MKNCIIEIISEKLIRSYLIKHHMATFFCFFLIDISPFVGTVVALIWTSADIFPGFQSIPRYLYVMNSTDSPLVRQPPTSWQPAW